MNAISNTKTALSSQTMLARLTIRAFSGKREDKKVTAEVARTHNTSTDAGKYSKNLIAPEALAPISKAANAMRQYHYQNTLPWRDDGARILPAANYERYTRDMGLMRDTYESAVRDFVADWPKHIEDAKQRLNGMFDARDYPLDIGERFGVRNRFFPTPSADDFRVDISDGERARIQSEIQEEMLEAQKAAMGDLYHRLGDAVKHMAERLAAYHVNDKGKAENPFRDSLVENLRELVDVIPRLNFAGDQKLESIRQSVARELTAIDADGLRDNFRTRETVQKAAETLAADIESSLAEFMA